MKVTQENIKDIKYIDGYALDYGKKILKSLLIDLQELNNILINTNQSNKQIYIDYEDKHTEYSSERTDPCPDFYGAFTLRFENNTSERIGDNMNLYDLDNAICILYDFNSLT